MKQTLNKFQIQPNKLLSSIDSDLIKRDYVSLSGKTKEDKDTYIDKIHQQMLSDFDIIYHNPEDAQIFALGNLCTKNHDKRFTILLSKDKNVNGDIKPQHLQFYPKVKLTKREDIYFNHSSKIFFRDDEVRKKIQESPIYQKMKNDYIQELQQKKIAFYVASTEDEMKETELSKIMNNFPDEVDSSKLHYTNELSLSSKGKYPKMEKITYNNNEQEKPNQDK